MLRELVSVRAELQVDFASSKGNAVREARLWELVAAKMSSSCSGQECKRHWQALVSRYKAEKKILQSSSPQGKEASDFPFFQELDAIYSNKYPPLLGQQAAAFTSFSDEEEEEPSSSNETPDDDDESDKADDSRDVQEVLQDLFQRMPFVPPAWPWSDVGLLAKAEEEQQLVDQKKQLLNQTLLENGEAICKQELVAVEDRMPRWGYPETKEFIAIRAEMEREALLHQSVKKNLWEPIAERMKQRGFTRSSEQCKRKWKKLVNRYKGRIANGQDNGRKFPVFQDLDDLFKTRLSQTAAADGGGTKAPSPEKKDLNGHVSEEDGDSTELAEFQFPRKKRKTDGMHQVLSDFIAKQMLVDHDWQEFLQTKQQNWQKRDEDWRSAMERLQQQRTNREIMWRERESQRLARQETRALKWDKLFAMLVDGLATS